MHIRKYYFNIAKHNRRSCGVEASTCKSKSSVENISSLSGPKLWLLQMRLGDRIYTVCEIGIRTSLVRFAKELIYMVSDGLSGVAAKSSLQAVF